MAYFRPIIERWKSKAALAAELNRPRGTVQQWWTRDAIPPEAFPDLERVAKDRGFEDVTVETLFEAHRLRWPEGSGASAQSQATEAAL